MDSYGLEILLAVPIGLRPQFHDEGRNDAETLFRRSADARGEESAGGRKPPECCETVESGRIERDQLGATLFGSGIGQSESDGRTAR